MSELPLQVSISSRDRKVGSNNDFHYTFDNVIDVHKMTVQKVSFPNSFYDVRTGVNDHIDFTQGGGPQLNAQIAPGKFTSSQFQTAVKTALEAVSGGVFYTVTISQTTGKITISNSVSSAIVFLWSSGTFSTQNAAEMMGYLAPGDIKIDSLSAVSQTSPYPVDLNPTKRIYLRVSPLDSHMFVNNKYSQNVISIPTNSVPFSDIVYEPKVPFVIPLKTTHLSSINIVLTYRDGSTVDLNGKEIIVDFLFE